MQIVNKCGLVLLLMLLFTACDNENTENPEPGRSGPAELGERIEAFGLDLYHETYKTKSDEANICVSPLSVMTAVAMVYNGADGNTRDDIASTLYMDDISIDSMNSGFVLLKDQLQPNDNKVQMHSVNSAFWDESRIGMNQDFLDEINISFQAETQKLDFNKEEETLEFINGWVEENTNDKIKDLLKAVKPSDVLFLINALYFKGDWENAFDERETYDEEFIKEDGSSVSVPFMHLDYQLEYYKGTDYYALNLPFGESGYSMTFLLPANPSSFGGFIENLNQDLLHDLYTNRLKKERVMIKLPRFDIKFEIKLNDVLTHLGMGIAFSEFEANLTKLGNAFGQNLFIDRVIHKTNLTLDEHGVEGAAATAVGVGITSVPPNLDFDRPFVYVLRHEETNTVLFLGHVGDPSSE